jgi:hypothetical protein
MSETLKRFIGVITMDPVPVQPIVKPEQLPVRLLASIDREISQAYSELGSVTLRGVEAAIIIGKGLKELKSQLKHGEFAGHVTATFPFTMRWGQRCISLANHEPEIMQELERLANIGSHLSLTKAFEYVGSLNRRPKLRRKKLKPI